ncbi:ubiquitin-associated protein 1-like [Oppia nitens]|uniref:ubiquitin-associated protein 1-like n=1 Tax=Oppia nitens TaxID=1686743 RepID=UPI0023DB091B|nr:ubiquitin-associated protein 1-like [Oppia nitens]
MTNKSHEISVYIEDIPMRLSERYRPLDVSAYTEEETRIPEVFDQHYKFSAELYALEVFEFRDKQRQQELSESMSKLSANCDNSVKSNDNSFKQNNEHKQQQHQHQTQSHPQEVLNKTIHLNPGEILKPLPTGSGVNQMNNNNHYLSNGSIDPNVNIKRKIVKDFESDTSSPFDFVELQSIDYMQELNDVFQAFNTKTSQHQKPTVDECHNKDVKSDNVLNNTNNMCLNQNLSAVHNMNGVNVMSAYGHHQQSGVTSMATPVSVAHSGHLYNSQWTTTASTSYSPIDNNMSVTTTNINYNYITDNNISNPSDPQQNLLRSSKSVSDLPTLVDSEDSLKTTVRRQRSHTPPCSTPKNKTRNVNEKQTLILNDPYNELSQFSKDFVNSINSMGFERSRVARAVKHIDNDHKKVIDFLLQVQKLEESGYDCCESEIALHMNNYQIPEAKKFLESLRQLSEVGFDKREIIKALIKCNNDRDKALDILLNTE